MDVADESVLDVDLLADDGSEEECEAPPSSDFYAGPASTPTSCASSPRGEEPASPHGLLSQPAFFHHQPYARPFFTSGRRGPGRPRKEGAKLAREGKIVRRYRSNPGSVRGAKRHRGSRDDALDDMMDEDDFTMPAPEEPPYMPEKWPGKVCALCNLSERSQLGQGEMRQFACNVEGDGGSTPVATNSGGATPTSGTTSGAPTMPVPAGLASPPPELVDPNQANQTAMPLSRRQKAFNKCKTPLYNMEHTDELSIIGYVEPVELPTVVSSRMLYIHRCCLEFSPPFQDQVASSMEEDKEQLEEARIRGIVTMALSRKCSFCQRHGASIPCKMSCSKYYHLPCVLASGGFMDFHSKSSFCKDHLYQVPLICAADTECRTCRTIGDIANLMTCVMCGAHYHGTCVGLAQLPGVRAGWACRACRVCQVCRGECAGGSPADARAVACEHCDKLYHATCLRPVMATVPKYGWKCKCCRVCSDCGARSPGAGPSSRWHAHYTVCDSCYQQRNKGSCCPLCRRAYRAAAYRDMIRCTACRRYVHGMCDPDAEPQQYRQKKEQNPTYEYNCPLCKAHMQLAGSKSGSFEEDNMASTSQDSSFGDENSQHEQDPLAIQESKPDVGLGKGKPFTVSSKVAKKKIGGYKLKGGFPPTGKLGFQKRQRSVLDFGRKRGSKPKMRGVFGVPGLGLQRPQAPDNKTAEDDPGMENKLILCSSKDKFVLTQDLCVMCGAVGTDSEGCLIACAQCGQTYHPYCVNIKVSAVIVSLGWRCLECTVCEGCGSRGDEPLLVLCDDCDTAWHTYCARPALPEVPRGAWRCERCRRCLVCGTVDTPLWCDNYTECAPCASLVMCCVCSEPYSDGELIIQCFGCRRWLHAACDNIRSEADAEICCRAGYKCSLCRGRDVPPPHMARAIEPAPAANTGAGSGAGAGAGAAAGAGTGASGARATHRLTAHALGLAGEYYVDDVCLSQRGAHHMKQLEADMGITHTRRKRRFKNENAEKDAVVQNAEADVGDDSKPDSTAEVKEEPGIQQNMNLKEGILWNVANDGPAPEGFTIYTTDSGLTVLRRKRQRNLNKLGIGGFVVRQRQATVRAHENDDKDGEGNMAGESPGYKRKPRRKPRSKLMEQFPSYMQEAFFGKDLLEPVKSIVSSTGNPSESPGGGVRTGSPDALRELRDAPENSDSDGEDVLLALTPFPETDTSATIQLNAEEIEILQSFKPKVEKDDSYNGTLDGTKIKTELSEDGQLKHTEDSTALKNAILGPQASDCEQPPTIATESIPTVHSTKTETISETGGSSQASTISPKDDLSLLGVNLDAMVRDTLPDMDSNDVDEIFKGVLTDDSQESQESSVSYVNSMASTPYSQRQQLQSPMDYASPYHTEFGSSNSALSPLFPECGGAGGAGGGATGAGGAGGAWGDAGAAPPPSYNQRSADKMRADESLGSAATISAVLYANTNHPEWKTEFPNWVDRCKQILKKWRALPSEQKAPYLQRARDNRSAIRMKKAQQNSGSAAGEPDGSPAPAASPAPAPSPAPLPASGPAPPPALTLTSSGPPAPAASSGASAPPAATVRAPNVTVTAGGLLEADAHIRVLTPSEIMRTLPRLAHSAAPAPPAPAAPSAPPAPTAPSAPTAPARAHTEQERACGQQRSAREAEQERQWKQLQQMRQQQTQQQQQIIHDQRIQAAMQRLRAPDGSPPPVAGVGAAGGAAGVPGAPAGAAVAVGPGAEAPRSTFPVGRFQYASNDDINRQLRDLLQRHPDKMWPPRAGGEEGGAETQPFRQPLPVGLRPRVPLHPAHRPDQQHIIMHQRLIATECTQLHQNIANSATQQVMDQKQNIVSQQSAATGEAKTENSDQGTDEMDIGDMDKLEQDPGNIGEVDILGLGGEDDDELLQSLTAEIGEQFNILEYADPELAALNDAEHLLDGLELADDVPDRQTKRSADDDNDQKPDIKMDGELQKAVKSIEDGKSEVKTELVEVKSECQEVKTEPQPASSVGQIFQDGMPRVITPNQQAALQSAMQAMKAEVKMEGEEGKEEWRGVTQRPVFSHMFGLPLQLPAQQQSIQRPTQFGQPGQQQVMGQQIVQRPQIPFTGGQHIHFTQTITSAGQVRGANSAAGARIVSAMTAQVQAALAAGKPITPGMHLLAADGAVGVVRHDRSVALAAMPHSAVAASGQVGASAVTGAGGSAGAPRAAPPPPYPGTLRAQQPPPPPYPQEQPLLLEELLEQEKREQEREGGEWTSAGTAGSGGGAGGGAGAAVGSAAGVVGAGPAAAPPPPAVPLFAGVPPPQPPAPPDRPLTEADHHARLLYEQWLQQYNAFAADQHRYYEAEVQKLRKIRKSLNSKQRQLRKSGNELTPNDAAELQRVSTEQQALQKHLEAARKQARQHSVLMQEYDTKQRQQNPQLAQQSVINQQQIPTNQTVFAQNQNIGQPQLQQQTINRPMQIGVQSTTIQQSQTLIRTQQTVLGSDGQPLTQQRIGLVTSPLNTQGRTILQGGRTLVIEQTGAPQPQLVRQLSGVQGVQERAQTVGGMVQFTQQQLASARGAAPRPAGARPAMSPLHVQSPHAQSPLHSLAPQSPLHHLTSPMQSPLHSQQSPLHHTSQSPLHPSTQSPLHTQQSPLHSQQSPMHVQQQQSMPQQSPMHPQQSPMHPQQSPIHQPSQMHPQNPMSTQHSPMHPQQSPMHPQQSPMHPQQSPMHPQHSPMHPQQSPMHPQQSPMHSQQSPMHLQQSPMHTQQSPMQSSMSPQHFLQQLQAQRTSPQLPTPSRSPQIYQQSQIQSPVASHSPQLQSNDFNVARFSRPAPGCSPLPTRFARPPHHQQGMRVGVPFGGRQQTSPLGSPQPMPSPGNTANEMARQQMLQRQQYSPMGGAPASPSLSRSPHVARTPTPSASPAASPAPHHDHGGGTHHHHMAPIPPGYRYFKPGLFGGAPIWPIKDDDRQRPVHINKVSIIKSGTPPRQRYSGKTAAPTIEGRVDEIGESSETRKYVLYSADTVDYASASDDSARMSFAKDDDDDDIDEYVEHLDDDDIVVVEPGVISPEERIATEEDFEELIDSGKPEDEIEEETPPDKPTKRTETTTKTVAVISLATAKQPTANMQQYKIVNPSQSSALSRLPVLSATVLAPHANTKILNEVSQATVASVSIANQTISVPVLKSLAVPIANMTGHASGLNKSHIKKLPLNISNPPLSVNMSTQSLSKPISSVISVISSNVPKVTNLNPVITLATSNTSGPSRVPVSILTQHQIKQKIVKTIEKPTGLSLSNTKLSSLCVTHDATLPAKIFQDEAASPDSTVTSESSTDLQTPISSTAQHLLMMSSQGALQREQKMPPILKDSNKDIDIETEISQQTELPHSLCITERTPMILGKADIKSPDPIPEKIPDNIMEGDDEDKPEDTMQSNLLLSYNKPIHDSSAQNPPTTESNTEENVVKTIKAIANQTKEMVIDSNMQITSDMAQESVQISIPSPTPSQERYLNDITMREHSEAAEDNPKHVESFEDMLCILEGITEDGKPYPAKQPPPTKPTNVPTTSTSNSNLNVLLKPETKDLQEQPTFSKRDPDRLGLQSATVPQLSPLSQPAELTTNMANVSQQLRTIMSSLNTSTTKVESQTVSRKMSDATTPTQVNFENLLPSSKVEVASSRPSPIQRTEKPVTSTQSMECMPMSAAQVVGSRVNTLSTMGQIRKSPNVSPISSPVGLQTSLMKSPAQAPLITNQSFMPSEDVNTTSIASQIIQMPALSKIHSSTSTPSSMLHSNNTITTSVSYQKNTSLPTSILGHTLLQPTRQSNLPFNTQNITSSQPPALVMTSRPIIGSKEPAPNVTVRTHSIVTTAMSQMQPKPATGSINFITSSKLLHTQLTSPLKRSKSTDEPKSEVIVGHIQPTKRHSVESVIVKSEPMETDEPNVPTTTSESTGNKIVTQGNNTNQRNDESQNVLLKQLLQTTTTSANVVPQRTMTIQRTAPALGTIPSLEAQLARPSIPPPTLALTQEVEIPKNSPRHITHTTVNSPFTSRPIQTPLSTSSVSPMIQTSTQSLMDVRKPPLKILNKEETTPVPECSPTVKTVPVYPMNIDNQQIQQTIKKEVAQPQQSPVHRPFTPMDVKKELLDESSQQSATSGVSTASDQGKLDQPMKEEFSENTGMDNTETNAPETPSEAKKRKRREYQQKKRKQMQMNMKAAAENNLSTANAKKRPRKGSRYEEDYDTFIDNLMAQLRLLPPMQIQEPALNTNFAVCPLFGSGDLTKLKNKDYDILKGDLIGEFGNAKIPNVGDYYNTKPFGDEEPLPEKPPTSTQRGFYDQEFQPIMFDEDPEDKKLDFICKERDTDTPDTIISCSSPEGFDFEPADRFPGLKLIDDEEEEEDEDTAMSGRISPIIPLIAPIPIRMKPLSLYQVKDEEDNQKSLKSMESDSPVKSKIEDSPGSTESNENVTVTLTLTSGAAEDILGVLKELAGILHIPPPTAYQIIERTATPPSHKLGLYRSKGKDGKEGTPIDIQSILNGAAKFCRHCDVVILDSVVRAKASEFPLLSANKGNAEEILCDSDSELFFCSTQCYERFAWRPTNIILDGKSKKSVKEDNKSDIENNLSKDRDDFDTASTESMETDDLDIKPDIKDEKMDLSFIDSLDNDELMKEVGDDVSVLDEDLKSVEQEDKSNQSTEREKFRGIRYKSWAPGCIGPPVKYKRPTDRELTELVFRTGVAIMPVTNEDTRKCELCGIQGDGVADGVSRLLNCDVDRWVHLNCALWSEGVYETVSGALMNVDTALAAGVSATCAVCRRLGATVRCFKVRCGSVYHLGCAVKDNCVFYKNKSAFCASHAPKNEKDNELTTLSVQRRVFVSRDEQRQVASVMLHSDTNHLIRVGGLIFLSPGHLLPHQLAAFHTPNYIYPIGYKIVRFYWSMSRANSRCRYLCWISEEEGRPRFHVRAQDESRQEMCAPTPRAAWAAVLDAVGALREGRREDGVLKLWPNYVTGEDLFGLTEPAVVRVLESLPGIETLTDYRFKFGRSALLEGGLAVNPSGCARCEARCARAWRRPARSLLPAGAPAALDTLASHPAHAAHPAHPASPYSKQFVHTKSSQYKKMKLEWRNNVYLARSKIQGLGLYAARDLEKHTMVIEYIGEIIRSELSELREKKYEAKNRGIYMFRLDERRVVDATLSGGLARYINHSCQPNCVAEAVEVDRHLRIIIFAKRRIARGEELAYDYKFDIEDDAHKIMCMCGAPNCRKWMN